MLPSDFRLKPGKFSAAIPLAEANGNDFLVSRRVLLKALQKWEKRNNRISALICMRETQNIASLR
jgi:hypothetical protein